MAIGEADQRTPQQRRTVEIKASRTVFREPCLARRPLGIAIGEEGGRNSGST